MNSYSLINLVSRATNQMLQTTNKATLSIKYTIYSILGTFKMFVSIVGMFWKKAVI